MEEKIVCQKCGTENNRDDIFCQECGSRLKSIQTNNTTNNWNSPFMYPSLIEIILFIVYSVITGFLIGQLFSNSLTPKYSISNIDNANSIMQQIYYIASNTDSHVVDLAIMFMVTITVLGGLFLVITNWSLFKFNRIEKRIIETQEMINKKG